MSAQQDEAAQELRKFAIDEAIRVLQHQEAELGRMRDRAIALAGLTATAAAFLVGAALKAEDNGLAFHVPLAIGTGTYALLLFCAWLLLRPVKNWNAKVSSSVIVEDFATRPAGEAYAMLAGFYETARSDNEAILSPLRRTLQFGLVLAGLTICVFLALVWFVA